MTFTLEDDSLSYSAAAGSWKLLVAEAYRAMQADKHQMHIECMMTQTLLLR